MLLISILSFVFLDYLLITEAAEKGLDIGSRHGYTWGAIIIGLNIVFMLSCYVVEKVLIELLAE